MSASGRKAENYGRRPQSAAALGISRCPTAPLLCSKLPHDRGEHIYGIENDRRTNRQTRHTPLPPLHGLSRARALGSKLSKLPRPRAAPQPSP
jgi:hypothetical protein